MGLPATTVVCSNSSAMYHRLDPDNKYNNIEEAWFRGVHSDIGGGNGNQARSNISLQWMLAQARKCGLSFNEAKAKLPRYSKTDRFSTISENQDVQTDARREVGARDKIDPGAMPIDLDNNQSHQCDEFANFRLYFVNAGFNVRITNPGRCC